MFVTIYHQGKIEVNVFAFPKLFQIVVKIENKLKWNIFVIIFLLFKWKIGIRKEMKVRPKRTAFGLFFAQNSIKSHKSNERQIYFVSYNK